MNYRPKHSGTLLSGVCRLSVVSRNDFLSGNSASLSPPRSGSANERRANLVLCLECWCGGSHLLTVSLSLEANTHTLINTSLTRSARGQVSGSLGAFPHGDQHYSVNGLGPVSINADLKAMSVTHKYV